MHAWRSGIDARGVCFCSGELGPLDEDASALRFLVVAISYAWVGGGGMSTDQGRRGFYMILFAQIVECVCVFVLLLGIKDVYGCR